MEDLFKTLGQILKPVKTYEIHLLTPAGKKIEIYTDNQPLQDFETAMIQKYGTFVNLFCKEL